LVDFLLRRLELLRVVCIDRLKFLIEHLELFIQVGDFKNLLLQFLDHLLLRLGAFLGHVSRGADFLSTRLIIRVQLRVVLCQLAESLTRRRLNLECLKLFESICTVHSFQNGIDIADELLSEHLSVMRENMLF